MGVKRRKLRLLIRVTWTGSCPAQRRPSSSAAVTPAQPPPTPTTRGARVAEGRARMRPPARRGAGVVLLAVVVDVAVTVPLTLGAGRWVRKARPPRRRRTSTRTTCVLGVQRMFRCTNRHHLHGG